MHTFAPHDRIETRVTARPSGRSYTFIMFNATTKPETDMYQTVIDNAHAVYCHVRQIAISEGASLREATARGERARSACIRDQITRIAAHGIDVSFYAVNGITVSD